MWTHNSKDWDFPLTVDLCDVSTTLHSNSDVNSSKAFLAQQQDWLQKLNMGNGRIVSFSHCNKNKKKNKQTYMCGLLKCGYRGEKHRVLPTDRLLLTRLSQLTLYWRVAGSTISRGLPFTLMRPFPLLQWATAVAVFCDTIINYKRGKKNAHGTQCRLMHSPNNYMKNILLCITSLSFNWLT